MGWRDAVVTASEVIIIGTAGELLVYKNALAAGNLIASISGAATGTDTAGNTVFDGSTFLHFNTVNGNYFIAANFNGLGTNGNTIVFETAASEAGPWTTQGVIAVDNAGNLFFTGTTAIQLGSPVITNPVSAYAPGSTTTAETWTAMSGFTNSWAATANTPRYRLMEDNMVQIDGVMDATSATAGAFFTIPAAYRPVAPTKLWASGANGGVIAGQAPFTQVASTGVMSVGGVTLPTAGAHITITGRYPLD